MSGEQIVTLCMGLAGIIASTLTLILSFLLFNKNEKIYLKKQEAIYGALALCDKYFSWLSYNNPDGTIAPKPIRNPNDTVLTITEEARLVYNNLWCSCKSKELLDVFLDLIVGGKKINTFKTYDSFRNMCRKELGLDELNDLNEERVFLAKISTQDLTKNSQQDSYSNKR